ncbi:MAG TPA: hypothetical protein VMY37_33615 [Thermoguttaceae bacterium]|nr:hypothetical protein [Thermoguttaceae bacterium]
MLRSAGPPLGSESRGREVRIEVHARIAAGGYAWIGVGRIDAGAPLRVDFREGLPKDWEVVARPMEDRSELVTGGIPFRRRAAVYSLIPNQGAREIPCGFRAERLFLLGGTAASGKPLETYGSIEIVYRDGPAEWAVALGPPWCYKWQEVPRAASSLWTKEERSMNRATPVRRAIPALCVACGVLLCGAVRADDAPAPDRDEPCARSVAIFSQLELDQGASETVRFTAPPLSEGRGAVLVLKARLDTPNVAGHTPALRLDLNGTRLEGRRLVNKPARVASRAGRIYSMAAGDRMMTFYSPDFASPDEHPHYGLQEGVKACDFELRVTDLLRPGENELVVQNAADPRVQRVLVAAEARLELREPPPPPPGPAAAPTGPLPRYEPRATFETDYTARELPEAKIEVAVAGERFVVESRFSTPKPEWTHGGNAYFRHERRVEQRPEAILVFDTFTNLTSENLAVMHRHAASLGDRSTRVWLSGLIHPSGTGSVADSSNPTSLAATATSGIGLIALDDVFRLHVTSSAEDGAVALADNYLALKPKAAYTAEWAIVPCDAPDYWRFINTCRRLVDANFTIPGAFAFLRASHHTAAWTDEQVRDFLRFKDATYACASIGRYQGRNAHGTAFQRVDHDVYREAFARRRRLAQEVKNLVYFHCFLDTTDEAPEQYADSRTLLPDGKQADYGMPYQRLFFPTESNSYGPAIARNVDVILDGIGAEGVYWDEHEYSARQYHYGEPWDGVSCDVDPQRMTIRRLKSSVTLLSEPWRLALARRIMTRGPLVGNGVPRTRAMAALEFPCFVETGSISNCTRAHLYSPIALGDHLTERSEEDAYGTMLAALDFGCVYHWYNDLNVVPTHHHLTRSMYPITPLELHEGFVLGRERVVTNRSGQFGFGDACRHETHVFNHEGREVAQYDAPLLEIDGKTYTELRIPEGWSAAIVRK